MFRTFHVIGLFSGMLMLMLSAHAYQPAAALAQIKNDLPEERRLNRNLDDLQRDMQRFERRAGTSSGSVQNTGNLSFRNFLRGGLHTGNLLQVPFVTNLNVSAGYWGSFVTPNNIIWPRGSGVRYGHTMTFGIGARVTDDNGDTFVILSESYNRGGGDRDPSGSHQYFFTPMPGYYNMYGSRNSANRLNDNADDRARLEAAGYYFVGGLTEDAFAVQSAGADGFTFPIENRIEYTAMSHLPETWPAFWPVGSYPGDDRMPGEVRPGLRAGRWNGFYGAFVRADQESYYVTDDRDNDNYPYYPFYLPGTTEPDTRSWAQGGRRGIGLEVSTRQYQWASILAEDIFIATYDITNISRNDIDELIMFQIVDYDIAGQTGNNEAFFDTNENITYQWLKTPLVRNGFRVGYGAVGFLLSPGNAEDGIDNDRNGLVDESQFDGIDNDGDWRAWEDVNGNGVFDIGIDIIWDDVGSDGLGPEDEGWPGPDPDGTEANGRPDLGEPNFEITDNDEIDQIGLTNMVIRTPGDFTRDIPDDEVFWNDYIQPVPPSQFIIPAETADIIYVYSSGKIKLPREQTERFAIAYLAGNDFNDILRSKNTMQNIYDADFNFAQPPNEPFLRASAGDGEVRLVWDDAAERSRDPIYGFDFEMYKVYRSTDPEFNDIKTISDAFGNPLLWEPIAQFDIENGLTGAHPVPIGEFGVSYDMGSDSGLEYSFIDRDVQNGRTYYYAVASVDHGYADNFFDDGISQLPNLTPISPTESGKVIEVDIFERVITQGKNTAVVTPQPASVQYVEPELDGPGVERVDGTGTGRVDVTFVLPEFVNPDGHTYEFTFTDDNRYRNLDSLLLDHGLTNGFTFRNVTTNEVLATHDPAHTDADIFNIPALNVEVYDGMKIKVTNPPRPEVATTGWLRNVDRARRPSMEVQVGVDGSGNTRVPRDYELRVGELGADTSRSISAATRIPVNYEVWDVTNPNNAFKVPLTVSESSPVLFPQDTIPGVLSPGDVFDLRISSVNTPFGTVYTGSSWRFRFNAPEAMLSRVSDIRREAGELYDTLAVYQVRGLQNRPYGNNLNGRRLGDFLNGIADWYPSVQDSLNNVPGLNIALAGFQSPLVYRDELNTLYEQVMPVTGDRFLMTTDKPFNSSDIIRFTVSGNRLQESMEPGVLDEIYVAPDPYIAVNPLESRATALPGRGEQRIDFRKLPSVCTIRIFTTSGRLVKTIHHSGDGVNSMASWDLKSDDGLNVAFGVYIYHIDAPGIGEKVGRFALIK